MSFLGLVFIDKIGSYTNVVGLPFQHKLFQTIRNF